jgi:hypothetical protein
VALYGINTGNGQTKTAASTANEPTKIVMIFPISFLGLYKIKKD